MGFTNSPLVSCTILTPYHTEGRYGSSIDSVAIHIMDGNLTAQQCGEYFKREKPKDERSSSNYGIGSDGKIGLYVEEKNRSWCTSTWLVDRRAVTIEVANITGYPEYRISDAAYNSLIALLVDICRRNNISALKWKADKDYAKSRATVQQLPVTEQNMFVHRWFAAKACPGNWLYNHMGQIANDVNKKLGSDWVITGVPVEPSESPGPSIIEPQFLIDYSKIKPYVVSMTRSTDITESQLKTVKDNGTIGVLIEGGYLYTSGFHEEAYSFRNPKVHDQVMLANSLKLPHGFILFGRARNTVEASKEVSQLTPLIQTLPPALGVWIRVEMPNPVERNDIIIDKYHKELLRLGLVKKMGLIANAELIQKFTWSKHMDNWSMLWEEPISSTFELGQMLTPEFFDLGGRYT